MAESQSTRDTKAWLAAANAAAVAPSVGYGGSGDTNQSNPTSKSISGAGRDVSSDGSLDKNS